MINKPHRYRTAIRRTDLSRPMRIAMESCLIRQGVTVLDYGCGRGDDLRGLETLGISCWGWDPVHKPDGSLASADVVNLGYVVNVIEDPEERNRVLQHAWSLTGRVLLVSARLEVEARSVQAREFADGYLTSKGTFQKFYAQGGLRDWIEATLGVSSVAAAPGLFLVFRDQSLKLSFQVSQYRRVSSIPRQKISDSLFNQHKEVLAPLMDFFARRGRLPEDWELDNACVIAELFGNISRAFTIIRRVAGSDKWDDITTERKQDMMIYLALARFGGRPRFSELPVDLQHDVRAFCGTYTRACQEADALLMASGNMDSIDVACKDTSCGKLLPDALYVHVSGLVSLAPILRIYEGCARRYIGVVDGANLVKLHRRKPQVSYLCYPEFDSDPHPALLGSLVVPLQTFDVRYYDYANSDNPFILHRKEQFLPADYPLRSKFEKLTRQEERWGLYENQSTIGTRNGWNEVLRGRGVRLRGHQVCRVPTTAVSDQSTQANPTPKEKTSPFRARLF